MDKSEISSLQALLRLLHCVLWEEFEQTLEYWILEEPRFGGNQLTCIKPVLLL